jgi:DUF1680 family protein
MLVKILAAVGGYLYAQDEDGLYVNLYAGSTANVTLKGAPVRVTQQTRYPWDGQVVLTLQPSSETHFTLHLRAPNWCEGAGIHGASARVNGAPVQAEMRNGYLCLSRGWHSGDQVELLLPMPVRRVVAHPNVEATRGKVALQRGPIVYAVEGLDNGGTADLTLATDPQLTAEYRPDCLDGVSVIRGRTAQRSELLAIPFYAIANRGKTPMRVWLGQEGMYRTSSDGDRLYYTII